MILHYRHKKGFGKNLHGSMKPVQVSLPKSGTIYHILGSGVWERMTSRQHEAKIELLTHNNGARRRLAKALA